VKWCKLNNDADDDDNDDDCNDIPVQVFWLWCGNAVYHSVLLFWMTVVAVEQGQSDDTSLFSDLLYFM